MRSGVHRLSDATGTAYFSGAAVACRKSYILVLILACLAGLWPGIASPNSKSAELQRKTADIALLQQQLQDRVRQAEQIRSALLAQQRQLVDEINVLRKQHQINSLGRAEQIPRIRYNIELLRSMMAYVAVFDSKIRYFQTGREKMSYLLRMVEDDIKMINTLNDLKIDALTTQISLIINRYLPDAHIIQVDPNKVEPLSAQTVWDSILNTKTQS
jgi:hypothetical protein